MTNASCLHYALACPIKESVNVLDIKQLSKSIHLMNNALFIGNFPPISDKKRNWYASFIETKQAKTKTKEFLSLFMETEVVVTRSGCLFDKDLLSMAPNLKLIIKAGSGKDMIDHEYCKKHGIKIANTPGTNAQSVSELAIALAISLSRHIIIGHQGMKEDRWVRNELVGSEIFKKNVSVIGFGYVGRRTASLFKAMGCSIKIYDPTLKEEEIDTARLLGYEIETCENCSVKEADIIVLHTTYNPTSHHFINKKKVGKMKRGALLINLARGHVLDEDAVFHGLEDGIIGGAAIDTWWDEPPKDNRFAKFENVVMTPHIGANTKEALTRTTNCALGLVDNHFRDNPETDEHATH